MGLSGNDPSSSSYLASGSFTSTNYAAAGQVQDYSGLGMSEQCIIASPASSQATRHGSVGEAESHKKKRPGPKRDAKPAPSEKLERNRQAQRSHRERKELYTKELEAEVQRLKDMYLDTLRERDQAVTANHARELENRRLQEEVRQLRSQVSNTPSATMLSPADTYSGSTMRNSSFSVGPASHRAAPIASSSLMDYETSSAASAGTAPYRENYMPESPFGSQARSSDHLSQQQQPVDFSSPPPLPPPHSEAGSSYGDSRAASIVSPLSRDASGIVSPAAAVQQRQPLSIDYDELALDFVLTLERPCMTHAHYLMVRAHNKESQDLELNGNNPDQLLAMPDEVPRDDENHHISGHTLMASVPSHRHIMEHPAQVQEMNYPEGIQRKDLLRLLGLTAQLEINDEELPPVKAWLRVLQNPRLRELSMEDFADLKARLLEKVHCYRFGAVITEDDIVGTVESILEEKGIMCI